MYRIRNLFAAVFFAAIVGFAVYEIAEAAPRERMDALPSSPELVVPLTLGSTMPANIMVRNLEGEAFALSREVLRRPSILIFYRGGW